MTSWATWRRIRMEFYGSRNLKSKVGAKEVLVAGSGGVEKNIGCILCCRFKGRGMSWSRAGRIC